MFCCALPAHVLSLFFRFTLEQLTESKERQQKGKEASPAEQIGERGQAPHGPLSSLQRGGDSWAAGSSCRSKNSLRQNSTLQGPALCAPHPAVHSVSSLTHCGPAMCYCPPPHTRLWHTSCVTPQPQHSSSSLYQGVYSPCCGFPSIYIMPPPCFSFACAHLGACPAHTHTRPHDELCAQLMPAYTVSTECIRRLLEICGHASAQGAP